MNAETVITPDDWDRNGYEFPVVRVLAGPRGWLAAGPGWQVERQEVEFPLQIAAVAGDCWLVESGEAAPISVYEVVRSGMPLVIAVSEGSAEIDAELVDLADAYVFGDDAPGVIAGVLRGAVKPENWEVVRDLSDGAARMINALSAEAGRIADQLAQLAEAQRETAPSVRPVDAVLVRRMLRLRRDRDRYLPAEIFADPAWDMLLDLTAAQLEGKLVPVSSLCIAAAVPTTTALRWVRSLTEAGLLERQMDPADARRSHIRLSDDASAAMLGYLRAFSEVFVLR